MTNPSPAPDGAPQTDYKTTVFLPETPFPMKAGLPAAEPKWLERWQKIGLYERLRAQAAGRPRFVYHDGPPYANGHIHIGTSLNKILKDFAVRSRSMLGFDAPFVPGWDCHGLPIEWKVEEKYRSAGRSKDAVPPAEFRAECRAFADHWLNVQRDEFKRIGVLADWDHPYTTMTPAAEAQIVREIHKFAVNGALYRGAKPVMWSVVEKTALAEAEIEYHEKVSPTIFVRFKVLAGAHEGASAVIWTTTPWTMPGNRAIAYSPDIAYGLYRVDQTAEGSLALAGEVLLLADTLAEGVMKAAQVEAHTRLGDADPAGLVCAHPLRGQGYDFDVPLLPGAHVTAETGTGLVHTAPGHGEDDFELGKAHGLEVPFTVGEDGVYLPHVPIFAGRRVMTADGKDGDANGAVISELTKAGALLAKGKLRHDYPHSWRSKAPIIFRTTPQWFIAMDRPIPMHGGKTLRELALAAIDATAFYPPQGRNRLRSMVESRPDWVISRQRAWGVPIALFVGKADGRTLIDAKVNERIAAAIAERGIDAWYDTDPAVFLGTDYRAEDFERVNDIIDVWFESGSTHAFVLEPRADHGWPADLYLEGSDQHRGWFQSSLLESCGSRGRAPFKAVVTHGFILDEKGTDKMSKSKGNVLSPIDISNTNGADILRLWVASSDYMSDIRFGPTILASVGDSYRKIRNTLRFLLGALAGFAPGERMSAAEMRQHAAEGVDLELYMLHRLAELDQSVRAKYTAYDFNGVMQEVFNFCTGDLSAFYLDVRKDALYCDATTSPRRRASRTVLDETFERLVTWLAPLLPFTMEEVWLTRFPSEEDSVHLRTFPETPAEWRDVALAEVWHLRRRFRRVVTGALEIARRDKVIGASLEAAPLVYVTNPEIWRAIAGMRFADVCITSGLEVAPEGAVSPEGAFRLDEVEGVAVVFRAASGDKCARCWMVLAEVGEDAAHPQLCRRCAGVVSSLGKAA